MMERRFFNSRLEVRDSQGDEGAMIVGYAARWNVLSHDLGDFRERINPGCFARSLASAKNDVKCLRDHDNSLILGRQRNGTLEVSEDNFGLRFACRLNMNTTIARDAYELIRSGMVDECSFAFQVDPGGESWTDDKVDGESTRIRTLNSAQLYDVSIVSQPAYPTTTVSARIPSSLSSLDRSRSEFPEGYSLEIRSHVPTLNSSPEKERRQNLVKQFLTL